MSASTYKLRKRIKELEVENGNLRKDRNEFKDVVGAVFDNLTNCKMSEYVPPLALIKILKPLITKTRCW